MTYLWRKGQPITVTGGEGGAPLRFTWRGRSHRVDWIAKRWRVDLGWWQRRVWREYFKLRTADGLLVVVFHDFVAGEWRLQRLYD